MADKEHLDKMVDSIINKKPEDAQTHFHTYLRDKMREMITIPSIGGEAPATPSAEGDAAASDTAE